MCIRDRNRRWPPDCGSCARAAPARRTYGSSPGSIESACYAIVAAGAEDQWRSTGPASGRADGCSKRARPSKARILALDRRTVEAVLAGIVHDIRTPLTGIVALAELLTTSDIGAREREWATAIKSGADHLAALTTLIVDAVKADAAGLILQHEPFSPRRLAEAVGTALTARAGNKGIKVDIAFVPDLPAMVAGDALRLRAALENLVDNAVKFTSEGAVVFTTGFKPAGRSRVSLIFTVADSGIGIEPREIKNLFRPFTQASEAVVRRYGGAGLGLVF